VNTPYLKITNFPTPFLKIPIRSIVILFIIFALCIPCENLVEVNAIGEAVAESIRAVPNEVGAVGADFHRP